MPDEKDESEDAEDETSLRAAEKDSLVIKKNAKGEMTWEAKIYGNTTLMVGIGDMKARMRDLIAVAEELTKIEVKL